MITVIITIMRDAIAWAAHAVALLQAIPVVSSSITSGCESGYYCCVSHIVVKTERSNMILQQHTNKPYCWFEPERHG